MPANHPTRDAPFFEAVESILSEFWTEERIIQDAKRPRLRDAGPQIGSA